MLSTLARNFNDMARSMQRQVTSLEELSSMQQRFVADVSHELRTPLTSILGYTEMLEEGAYGELGDEQRDAVRRALLATLLLGERRVGAARWVSLEGAWRVLPIGLVLGISLPCMNWVHHPSVAVLLMILVGACGGFFVVPMNALLQHRGCQLLTAGQSIAIQNFNENLSVMAMMLGYSALMALDLPFSIITSVLGACALARGHQGLRGGGGNAGARRRRTDGSRRGAGGKGGGGCGHGACLLASRGPVRPAC